MNIFFEAGKIIIVFLLVLLIVWCIDFSKYNTEKIEVKYIVELDKSYYN